MPIDTKKIEELLKDKKYDEVTSLIKEMSKEELSSEENGEALVGFASIYMKIMNSINAEYRDRLKEAIEAMKLVNKSEAEMNDKAKLMEARASLNQ